MELLQLKYFLLLCESQHVSKTAEKLNISQPSLSSTIKKLEKELGVPLFVRKGRNLELSPYGQVYREYAREVFLALENGRRRINLIRDEDEKKMNLGILSPYVWNDTFRSFRERYPEIKINQFSFEGFKFLSAILDGEIDMYVGGVNNIYNEKIEYETLYDDEMAILMHKSHPFADRGKISLRECRDEKFINLDSSTNLQKFISIMYEDARFDPNVVMICDYTLRDQMVIENYGISVTTKLSAMQCKSDKVTYAVITEPSQRRKLGIAWKKNAVFTKSMQLFYDFAKEYYEDLKV